MKITRGIIFFFFFLLNVISSMLICYQIIFIGDKIIHPTKFVFRMGKITKKPCVCAYRF